MSIVIPIINVKQKEWDMYIASIKAYDLFRISSVDRLRLEELSIPKYAGFQRPIVVERVNSIRDFLTTPNAIFPNSIIVSLASEYIEKWEEATKGSPLSTLTIKDEPNALTIIDGQHRTAALDSAPEDFFVILTIFIDLDIIKSAEIFAKINSTQKAVNPSISYQLFGYAETRSPQKTAHDIASVLNTREGSPFYQRLKMLGTKDEWTSGDLSQATFSKYLMSLYCNKPQQDENAILRNEDIKMYSGYPLRILFKNKDDNKILKIFWEYFYIIASTWPEQWNKQNQNSIIIKTTGYVSFIQILKKLLLDEIISPPNYNMDKFKSMLEKIKPLYDSEDKKFIKGNYPAGNQGVTVLRDSLEKDLLQN